ncbi:L-glutamate gamma-semialdehyde dehydrogenase [Alicyclobacillus fastidiosus]|uniref:L-glutamate gamma-semialdehyde dehydrogenase n=1 Tax=Alicyclobacillus fastidiosus TaxID=392011 RepID=A0ABV5ACI0_9BACL|nr:L-glutamate gamma-semialdehyde dehydrogenase [Alicyclobacillus fastidiosus]WEH11359.1 L-glutamate gamma-semialdehyde dehydrogenase [Alicyclobacillus fastidiosus]
MIPYLPEAFTDFSKPENEAAFTAAFERVSSQMGQSCPLIIGGREVHTDKRNESRNPSNLEQIVGFVAQADKAIVDEAFQIAAQKFTTWSQVSPEERAGYLFKSAAIIRRRKHEFSSWLLLEAGKTRTEADADTAECIDFLEYYGRQVLQLSERGKQTLVPYAGEDNRLEYIPLGVGVVIPPWNFPLAIMAGMTAAAIVSGNTVLLKPASQTPVIAYRFYEVLKEAGLPDGVVNFVPGDVGEIGDYMVDHTTTRFVTFTGSRGIGVRIYERASKVHEGQIWLKRVIAEMGGKDSIIVDEGADLDLAALNIVNSAFMFSGQKCSACSRVIAHEAIYNELLDRVVERTRTLTIGDAINANTKVGPVIDQKAYDKIRNYIEIGKQEGRLVCGGEAWDNPGYFVSPTIFADVPADARLSKEEIFGPVVAFTKVKTFTDAIAAANNTEFGLTGSVFTRNREHVEEARRTFHVGNLYFNRKSTGALVGVHPFGGFNMSGTDSKAGGPDYLLLFTQPKLSSEVL